VRQIDQLAARELRAKVWQAVAKELSHGAYGVTIETPVGSYRMVGTKPSMPPKTLLTRLWNALISRVTGNKPPMEVSPAGSTIIDQVQTHVSQHLFFISGLANETASVATGRWIFGSAHSIWQKPRRHLGYKR
jgi:hypothetical protein